MIPTLGPGNATVGPFSVAYFLEEWNRFREIMCSTTFTPEQKGTAFGALFLVAVNIDPAEPTEHQKEADSAWEVIAAEFAMRNAAEILRPLRQRRTGR